MKRKSGFTLIELLAVIVILAIIMVIATMQVNKTIKKTRDNSDEANKKSIKKAISTCMVQENDNSKCDTISKLVDNGYIDEIGDPYSKETVSKGSSNVGSFDKKYIIEINETGYDVLSMLGDKEKVQKEKTLYLLNQFDSILNYASKKASYYYELAKRGDKSNNVSLEFQEELNNRFKPKSGAIKIGVGQTDMTQGWRINIAFTNEFKNTDSSYLDEKMFNEKDICYYYNVHYMRNGESMIIHDKYDSMIGINGERYVKPYVNETQFVNYDTSKTNCNPNVIGNKKHLQ